MLPQDYYYILIYGKIVTSQLCVFNASLNLLSKIYYTTSVYTHTYVHTLHILIQGIAGQTTLCSYIDSIYG